MQLSNTVVALLGFLLGPVARTLYDYLFKVLEDPDIIFENSYWITMAASMIIGLVFAFSQGATIVANIPEADQWFIFLACFSQGFMLTHLINKPLARVNKMRRN